MDEVRRVRPDCTVGVLNCDLFAAGGTGRAAYFGRKWRIPSRGGGRPIENFNIGSKHFRFRGPKDRL